MPKPITKLRDSAVRVRGKKTYTFSVLICLVALATWVVGAIPAWAALALVSLGVLSIGFRSAINTHTDKVLSGGDKKHQGQVKRLP